MLRYSQFFSLLYFTAINAEKLMYKEDEGSSYAFADHMKKRSWMLKYATTELEFNIEVVEA